MKTRIIGLLLLFPALACQQDAVSAFTEVTFGETQCANPWTVDSNAPTDEQQARAVETYLRQNGIREVRNVRFEVFSTGPFCMACTCPSGRTVFATIPADDVATAEKLGFRR